jgi:hypothetical protein
MRGADFDTAERNLEAALSGLAPGDPRRGEVSFALGGLRLAVHAERCADPCPAPGELRQIVAMLAVAGDRREAPIRRLYPYAMTAAKLSHHTRDAADIDRAMTLLRRVVKRRFLPAPERREALIAVAHQHAAQGSLLREAQRVSGPGSESWAAYTAAIKQFEAVLARLPGRDRASDPARGTDRIDALLGLLEAYGQRSGERPSDTDLDAMARLAHSLCTAMTPDYPQRAYALGRAGSILLLRIVRRVGDPWDGLLDASILQMAEAPVRKALAGVPGLGTDLDTAIGALTQAVGLAEQASRHQPLYTAALSKARALRFLVYGRGEDLDELARLCRVVIGHPGVSRDYRRQFSEDLLVVLMARVRASGTDLELFTGAAGQRSPSADTDLDAMIGLLERFLAADGAELSPTLSWALAALTTAQASGDLADAELAAVYARQRDAAAAFGHAPVAQAVLRHHAAATGAELVRRGGGPPGLAAEVAAMFQQAIQGFPAAHPMARYIASQAAAFDRAKPIRHTETATPTVRHVAGDVPVPVVAVQDGFDMQATALLGTGSLGRLAAPLGQVVETAQPLLAPPPGDPAEHAAVRCVLAMALHQRWLRERSGGDLNTAIDHVSGAIAGLPAGHPMRDRITELRAGMLLDRCQVNGDHADAGTAHAALLGLLRRVTGGRSHRGPGDLNDLLRAACAGTRSAAIGPMLTRPPAGARTGPPGAHYRLELRAALGSALLLRSMLSGDPGYLDSAVTYLRHAAEGLPHDHPVRPSAVSDLGIACLAVARRKGAGQARQEIAALLSVAGECPPGHPHRAAILLRAAGALAGDEDAEHDPAAAGQVIDLLTEALKTAGLDAFGERARCLYGLGHMRLVQYEHTRDARELERAISALDEAWTGLGPAPGDPFIVPLLRTLASACRLAGSEGPGLRRRQSKRVGRSLLHAHGRAVLLQSGSWHGLSAARRIGTDTLRLARWCLADGQPHLAVEALELGRGLVLHAATVAADIPALLDAANRPGLAREWRARMADHDEPGLDGPGHDGLGDNLNAVPSDLRHQVLSALDGTDAELHLLSAPTVAQIAATLRSVRMDALVYLIPASADGSGHALIVQAGGEIDSCAVPGLTIEPGGAVHRYGTALQDSSELPAEAGAGAASARSSLGQALGDVCDWAWTAVIGPVLDRLAPPPQRATRPARLVIAPIGTLGLVPWHAARWSESPGTFRYACEEAVLSTCVSARQLTEAAARRPLPRGRAPVFVANPTEDLRWSKWEADAICSALYPGAVSLGVSSATAVAGPGTPDEVLEYLPGNGAGRQASVLHLGCHALAGRTPDQSWLVLAGDQHLPLSRILTQALGRAAGSPGGLVVLAACASALTHADHDEALTLASGFIAAGATGVVGSRWKVSDVRTALLMFMLHRHLVRHPGDSPADALRAAQLWMADPSRRAPPEMPARLADEANQPGIADPFSWAAFTHHGQ